MGQQDLIPHLFRTEYRKIVSVLCKRFGIDQIEIAEDICSDTFLTAAQSWPLHGLPPHPTAWLYRVARNKAINHLQRDRIFESKISPSLKREQLNFPEEDIDLSPQNINDSQLQMMFAICHPSISPEAQVGLSLRFLCGFGIDEIAEAFLTNRDTIYKRLMRAREKLREEKIKIELPPPVDIEKRLESVITTLYLLFNEGYYSLSQDAILRKDLCLEAMRLCYMLIENKLTNKPAVNALLSLMCFHASRFEARENKKGETVLYDEQDTSLWNTDLISRGAYFLHCASGGNEISPYHVEAGIAFWITQKADTPEKWENVLELYNRLLQIEYSPIAALNRSFALSKVKGPAEAIKEAEKLNLTDNPFYFSLLGELYSSIDKGKSLENFQNALLLLNSDSSKQVILRKINNLGTLV
jgi:RNA polymerase sigma-70 factor (ECF subfamily)